MSDPLLRVRDLEARFDYEGRTTPVVRGVSFDVRRGETVGLVGESGSGKSVTAFSLLRLLPSPPGRISGGAVLLDGADLLRMSERELRSVRGGRVAMVFQDPFTSLNPTMRVGDQLIEAIRAHTCLDRRAAKERSIQLLRLVHMPDPALRVQQFPHQLSGGQRQRVMIAMAFAMEPDLIIADEPTTALDVTVQAQIVALMHEFRERTRAGVLLITHDLGLVAEMCDRVLVMYAGRIVESAGVRELFRSPRHPYTEGLLDSLPDAAATAAGPLRAIPGMPPDPAKLPPGCPFAPRCPRAMPVCAESEPGETANADGRLVRCHLYPC